MFIGYIFQNQVWGLLYFYVLYEAENKNDMKRKMCPKISVYLMFVYSSLAYFVYHFVRGYQEQLPAKTWLVASFSLLDS